MLSTEAAAALQLPAKVFIATSCMENHAHSALLTKSDFSSKCTLQQIHPTEPPKKLTHSTVPELGRLLPLEES